MSTDIDAKVDALAEEMRQLSCIRVEDYAPDVLAITVGRQACRVSMAACNLTDAIQRERSGVAPRQRVTTKRPTSSEEER